MSCQDLVELVTEYFEGTLPETDRARFEEHIEECFWCARYIDQMRMTIHAVGRIDEDSISPEAKQELLHVFRDWDAERRAS
jgi:anti-sigma factor RsiW